jgi:tetratricopeptide (TPR) repeat protein
VEFRILGPLEVVEWALQGQFWRLESLLEVGDVPRARTELAAARSAQELKQPAQLWYVAVTEALLALLEGSFGEAEDLVERALRLGQRAQSWEALAYYRLQLYALRSAQGRLDEAPEVAAGSVSRSLGVLAAALGRRDEGTAHFEDALAMNARMGARRWVARTQHDYGRMLLASDREKARALLKRAAGGYRALGMTRWAERAARLLR